MSTWRRSLMRSAKSCCGGRRSLSSDIKEPTREPAFSQRFRRLGVALSPSLRRRRANASDWCISKFMIQRANRGSARQARGGRRLAASSCAIRRTEAVKRGAVSAFRATWSQEIESRSICVITTRARKKFRRLCLSCASSVKANKKAQLSWAFLEHIFSKKKAICTRCAQSRPFTWRRAP